MDAGLWISGHIVPVSRVQARSEITDCSANTTLSFSFTSSTASTDASFKAQWDTVLGHLSGLIVAVDGRKTVGSFLSVEKASDLYGKENLESSRPTPDDDDKEALVCNIGNVESNSSVEITVSFVSELSPSSPGLLKFTIPAIRWLETKDELSYELDVDIAINLSKEASISSPSHPSATITQNNNTQTHVHLATQGKSEEFVLSISPASSYSTCVVEQDTDSETSDKKYVVLLSYFAQDGFPASLRVDWGDLEAHQIPLHSPSSPLVTLYTYLEKAPRAPITVHASGRTPETQHTATVTPSSSDERTGTTLHRLAARARVRELLESGGYGVEKSEEIRKLGLRYGLATRHTCVYAKSGRVELISLPATVVTTGESSSESDTAPLRAGSASSESGSDTPQANTRKVYDSKFLLTFREHFTDLPEGLPSIDIILGKGGAGAKPKTPNNNYNNRKGSSGGRDGRDRRGKQSQNGGPVEPLKQTDNRWQRPTSDAASIELLRRNVLGLLNKLTLEKFDSLSSQFAALKISSLEDLTEVCKLIFEKAILEQHFCSMYADLCKKLIEAYPSFVVEEDGRTVTQTFKRLLLNMCQKEFESVPPPKEPPTTTDNQQDKGDGDDPERKYRRRILGNIRFIGELFKLGLLREAIMHSCVVRLLSPPTAATSDQSGPPASTLPAEEDLEALCKLLRTMGKRLDKPGPDKERMDQYFATIASLASNKELPSRNRFMLKDLIDMRKNDWVPRREINGPKTIAAVHADAEKADRLAKEETALRESGGHRYSNSHARGSFDRGDGRDGRGDGRDGRGRDGRDGRDNRDRDNRDHSSRSGSDRESLRGSNDSVEKDSGDRGWETVGKSAKGNSDKWEVAGAKNKRGLQDNKGGRRDSFKSPPPSPARGNTNTKDTRDTRDARDKDKNKDRQRDNARKPGGGASKERVALAPRGNMFSSLDAIDEDDDGGSSSGSSTPTPRGKSSTQQSNGHNTNKLSTAQLDARADALLAEYLSIQDVSEAVESIRELQAPDYHAQVVVHAINMVLEQNKPSQLDHIDALFAQAFNAEELSQGFTEILENIEELDIDIPMASRHVATLIGSAIARGTLPFAFLFSALVNLVESGKAEVILGAALQKINKESGESKLVEMYDSSHRNLVELFKAGKTKDNINTFLQSKDLAFLAERLS
eukprot:Phypoly_transcript_01126.p1 GENE.Phypoly_transcript_01126~~Phypoly_transcript_01126.p1  ORF type:complete len:1171 (+),score=242.39 Phypoly_transcript_01126:67-3579(+)